MRTLRQLVPHFLLAVGMASVTILAGATAASAGGSRPDLVTTITPPSGISVYQSGRWNVSVANLTGKSASNVTLTIQLPRTANSPTQYLMGTLGTISPGCARSGFTIVCQPKTIKRNVPLTMYFDITLPYSTQPIVFTATAPTNNDANPADNTTTASAALATQAIAVNAPRDISNDHCTGTPALSSFIECTPGSLSGFTAQLLPGSTPTAGTIGLAGAGGTWSVNGTQLTVVYTVGTTVQGTFTGQGVNSSCWEGTMTFPTSTQYIALYKICLI